MRRALLLAICVVGLGQGLGCDGGTPPHDAAPLIARLDTHPGRLPADVPRGTQVVMLTVGFGARGVHIDGSPIPLQSSLKFERAMARRRTMEPGYWVLQTRSPGGAYHYWTPVDPSPRIRVSMPTDREDQSHVGGLLRLPEMYVALRIPFYPGGRVDLYTPDGKVVSRFRFDRKPAAPLIPVVEKES